MDSVDELAAFWDSHDVTDFAAELEIVTGPVFVKKKADQTIAIELEQEEAAILKRMARSKGVKESTLVRRWIREHLRVSPVQLPKIKASSSAQRVPQG